VRRNPKPKLVSYLIVSAAILVWAPRAWSEDGTDRRAPNAKRPNVKLYGISWHKSVDSARKAATAARPAKPVFVLRTLGDLAGLT
jgi:hypothetical protein